MMNDDFYIRLEKKFRGKRTLVKKRLEVYLPIINHLKEIYPKGLVVDLGCGRGEWLELLGGNGWQVQGVDSNRRMVALCKANGLQALESDAVEYLRSFEENSIAIVSGFHIAEHLPFDLLLDIFKEALRALLPGGMLILETPNPENIRVEACDFYLDPSHQNPLPPGLMQFVADDTGFYKALILRLNGPDPPEEHASLLQHVTWALGANPDYGLVAYKKPDMISAGVSEHIVKASSQQEDSLTLLNLALERFESQRQQLENEIQERDRKCRLLEMELIEREQKIYYIDSNLHQMNLTLQEKEQQHQQLEKMLHTVTHSRSWLITLPLRKAGLSARRIRDWSRRFLSCLPRTGKNILKSILGRLTYCVAAFPFLKTILGRIFDYFPVLKMRLKRSTSQFIQDRTSDHYSTNVAQLSPRAVQILNDLKQALKKND